MRARVQTSKIDRRRSRTSSKLLYSNLRRKLRPKLQAPPLPLPILAAAMSTHSTRTSSSSSPPPAHPPALSSKQSPTNPKYRLAHSSAAAAQIRCLSKVAADLDPNRMVEVLVEIKICLGEVIPKIPASSAKRNHPSP